MLPDKSHHGDNTKRLEGPIASTLTLSRNQANAYMENEEAPGLAVLAGKFKRGRFSEKFNQYLLT